MRKANNSGILQYGSPPEVCDLEQHTFYRQAVNDMTGDYFFACDVLRFAELLEAAGNAVYMYYFRQRSSANPWPEWMGVMHGYEIEYHFGQPIARPELYNRLTVAAEQQFSREIMKMWTYFATEGYEDSFYLPTIEKF